ncbi:RNA polymerase sigma-70 factor [Maribellus maritimus]|uniref:RNA polymerase sigma-70 factor n=1 Tax=Maribellus maritimus TaxID=2870838 RepID=UPI001EEC8079|nr:RNA polymerase sigma-70 factor [Maribellus maritimus]MCG6189172.1 RNA polymerase sigma-70 factor [Maribellus maritimus]
MDESFLINGIKSQNKIVFDFIFHYYYSGLCAFSEKITGNEEAAEDIVQDLFVTLWTKNEQFIISSSLKNYLFTSVKNRSLDFIKREKTKAKKINVLANSTDLAENLSTYWFAESELTRVIEDCLQKLPPRCREIFVLSRFEGLKNQEIADKLEISKRTVELQISNALKSLRCKLKPFLPIFLIYFLLK